MKKILVANRGEIAARVVSTCADLGIDSVAVHSDADAQALHVRLATESVNLGGTVARENYLDADAILEAARTVGADAVHPGYGFLAENAEFARKAEAAGIVFIGPPAAAIEAMGEKVAARAAAVRADVPVVPGTPSALSGPEELRAFAEQYGLPILVKAAHGGGGRGMRLIESIEGLADGFHAAVREAEAAFGDGAVYAERYLARARHIEIQLMADTHGNVVWLGDRDCSVQRRHQKLVEEAPADLPEGLRVRMGEAAVRLAREVAYVGAGTVEFLVEDDDFYFLEMNTRIQVEHPVTEETIGLDLIAEQIRVASGEPLSISESGPTARGHAIEVRVNAEAVAGGRFIPSPGRITRLEVPAISGVRFDAGYRAGDEIPPYYDSLVGKLIVWAPYRAAAIRKLHRALAGLRIDGVPTTAPAAEAIISHPDFVAGAVTTGWLEKTVVFPEVGLDETSRGAERQDVDASRMVVVGGREYHVPWFGSASQAAGGTSPGPVPPRRPRAGGSRARGRVGGSAQADGSVRAPMQGTIVVAHVAEGDLVDAGQLIFVLEAMKMENPIHAPRAGRVSSVGAAVGESVAAGTLLASIDESSEEDAA